jgi:hypothetical protein
LEDQGGHGSVEQLTAELKTEAGADISELIKTLGSGNYPQREEAARKIIAQGAAALPGLEKAGDDADPEIANAPRCSCNRSDSRARATASAG